MARIDIDYVRLESMKIALRIFTKGKTPMQMIHDRAQVKSTRKVFRVPTKKELVKHPKLIEKQRRNLGGA